MASLVAGSSLVGVGAGLAFGKDVTVVEDGVTAQVSLLHGSVAEVLVGQGIVLGPRDQVSPTLATRAADGMVITVRHSRPIDLAIDGRSGRYWTTATTIKDFIAELGFDMASIRVSTEGETVIGRSGLGLAIDRGNDITVTADGATRAVHAFGTVADALAAIDLTWDEDDLVDPAPTTSLAEVTAVTVTRVDVATAAREVDVPFATSYEDDASLYQGQTKVKSPGRTGAVLQTVRQVFHNGQLAAEDVLSEEPLRAPVAETVLRGTTARPASAAPEGVWGALAQCESGGNPATNTGNGYYGLYQFSAGTWRSVGGQGLPSEASAEEQTLRAQILQARSGWGQWPACARRLGLI
jgi:uncharacterized protein YabE (DUF348 family)